MGLLHSSMELGWSSFSALGSRCSHLSLMAGILSFLPLLTLILTLPSLTLPSPLLPSLPPWPCPFPTTLLSSSPFPYLPFPTLPSSPLPSPLLSCLLLTSSYPFRVITASHFISDIFWVLSFSFKVFNFLCLLFGLSERYMISTGGQHPPYWAELPC